MSVVRRSRRERKRDAANDAAGDGVAPHEPTTAPEPGSAVHVVSAPPPSPTDRVATDAVPETTPPPPPPAEQTPAEPTPMEPATPEPDRPAASDSTKLLAAAGVRGLSDTTGLTAARTVAAERIASGDPGDRAERAWIGVDDDTAMYALDGQDTVVAYLSAGTWFLTRGTYSRWLHVYDEERDLQGLVAADVVRPATG